MAIINSQSLPKLMSIELVMPSNHLILRHPLLLLPSIFPMPLRGEGFCGGGGAPRDSAGSGATEEAVPGPSVFLSGDLGVSGVFWGSQEGCQGPFRPSGQNRGLPFSPASGVLAPEGAGCGSVGDVPGAWLASAPLSPPHCCIWALSLPDKELCLREALAVCTPPAPEPSAERPGS